MVRRHSEARKLTSRLRRENEAVTVDHWALADLGHLLAEIAAVSAERQGHMSEKELREATFDEDGQRP